MSIRSASNLGALAFGLVALAVVAALVWTSSLLQRATDDVIRDTTSRALASQLELRLFGHHRLSTLYTPPDPALLDAREEIATEIDILLDRVQRYAVTEQERALVARVVRDVTAYRRERERLDALDTEQLAAQREVRAELERAVASVEALRQLNADAVQQAQQEAKRVSRLTTVAGAAAAVLLFAGLLLVVVGARRYVVRPLLELERTIRLFRSGDTKVRAEPFGSRELREVAAGFNAMIAALVRQRDARLAFTAGVAHDLRNPLAALHMGVEVAKSEPTEAGRSRVLGMIDRQVGQLARMVDDLLDATRIEAGKLELHKERVDLRETVREIVELYTPGAPNHRVAIQAPDEPVRVDADPLRMEQVTSNLVSNAIKYSPHGGRVDVKVYAQRGEAVLEVKDEGVGIPKDRMEELFTPFRRLATEVAPGAGLGLSVVRRIVEAHGGRIEVESVVRRGSTFRVRLPLAA